MTIINDVAVEQSLKQFVVMLNLIGARGGVTIGRGVATIDILDDDSERYLVETLNIVLIYFNYVIL